MFYIVTKTEANAAQGLLFSVSEFHSYMYDRNHFVIDWPM